MLLFIHHPVYIEVLSGIAAEEYQTDFDQVGALSLRGAPRATKQSRSGAVSGPRLLRFVRNDNLFEIVTMAENSLQKTAKTARKGGSGNFR